MAARALIADGFRIPFEVIWTSKAPASGAGEAEGKPEPKPRSKVKFTCGGCGANAWGKPTLRIACLDCKQEMPATE